MLGIGVAEERARVIVCVCKPMLGMNFVPVGWEYLSSVSCSTVTCLVRRVRSSAYPINSPFAIVVPFLYTEIRFYSKKKISSLPLLPVLFKQILYSIFFLVEIFFFFVFKYLYCIDEPDFCFGVMCSVHRFF